MFIKTFRLNFKSLSLLYFGKQISSQFYSLDYLDFYFQFQFKKNFQFYLHLIFQFI